MTLKVKGCKSNKYYQINDELIDELRNVDVIKGYFLPKTHNFL